jgi:cysteinyl-tRNA synthetase
MPYLRTLSGFRDSVRQLAISGASANDILALCDKLRDVDLIPLGVALDDQDGESQWPMINSIDSSPHIFQTARH